MTDSHLTALNTLCNTCKLEAYRETLEQILEDIFAQGCYLSLVKRENSHFKSKAQMGNFARIFLGYLNKKDCLDNIWALLKEYGNFMNEPLIEAKKDIPSYIFSREQFAWGFARDQVVKYPQLLTHISSFTSYRIANRYI